MTPYSIFSRGLQLQLRLLRVPFEKNYPRCNSDDVIMGHININNNIYIYIYIYIIRLWRLCIGVNFRFEKYLDVLNDKNRFTFCRFRTSNHRLPIEVGRWTNIERHNRLCQLCQSCEIGDEFHYVLQCPNFLTERKIIIPKILFQQTKRIKTVIII